MHALSRRYYQESLVERERQQVRDEALRSERGQSTTASSPGASSLVALSDVAIGTPAVGDVLKWDSGTGTWTNQPDATGAAGSGIVRVVASIAVNTAAAAAAATDYVYVATAALVLTLPTAVGNTNRYTAKAEGGAITLASTGAQTFDGTASPITIPLGVSLDLVSNGANWDIC
jgi:hypothetical protein